jgi:hypothetical protein
MVAWRQIDGDNADAMVDRYVSGVGWATPELLETDPGTVGTLKIAVNDAGAAFAVWIQADGSLRNTMANRYTPEAGWGTAVVIDTGDERTSEPNIAVSNTGDATAVWQQGHIWANTYLAD